VLHARRLWRWVPKAGAARPHAALAPTRFSTRQLSLAHGLSVSRTSSQPPAPPTTSHVLTTVVQNGLPIRAMLRQEEDRHRCRPLQGTLRSRRERERNSAHAKTTAQRTDDASHRPVRVLSRSTESPFPLSSPRSSASRSTSPSSSSASTSSVRTHTLTAPCSARPACAWAAKKQN
jgi:hypothetical protein